MAIRRNGAVLRQIRTLFNVGAIGELTDGQLLERFARRDAETAELAFAALVERHGPMVLRVCRSVLRDSHDAQDAFQATFLVLIKKARALWVSDSLGPWLHQVAYRTASCARSAAVRRRQHEKRVSEIAADATSEPAAIVNDWEPVLHEEIARLPARYRVPMVLCELEGRTHEQAARHLGWPVGTVKSRLARGRLRLRDRLIRRGLAPCGALSVLISSPFEATAAIPPALANSTIWGAKTFATANASTALAGLYSASVAALTKGVLRAMILTKLKIAALGVVSAGIIGTTVGILAGQEPAIKPEGRAVQSKEAKLSCLAAASRNGKTTSSLTRFSWRAAGSN